MNPNGIPTQSPTPEELQSSRIAMNNFAATARRRAKTRAGAQVPAKNFALGLRTNGFDLRGGSLDGLFLIAR